MKLAVLADIHANFVALQTVVAHIDQWQPDLVVVAGDIVNRGPRPAECWALVQQRRRTHGWQVVRGNHEDYVIAHSQPDAPKSGPEFEVFRSSYWTYYKLGCEVSALAALPFKLELDNGVRITHASMRHIRDGIYKTTPEELLREQLGLPAPAVLCVGHTHQPLIKTMDDTLVVNVGAAGMPFDGDWHPSYAQLEWRGGKWHAQIIRLSYDRAAAERDFEQSGFLDEAGPLAKLMLKELQIAQGQLFSWIKLYEKALIAGEITMEAAVQQFLAQSA